MLTQVEGVAKVTPTLFSSATKGRINHRDADCLPTWKAFVYFPNKGFEEERRSSGSSPGGKKKKKFFLTSNLL